MWSPPRLLRLQIKEREFRILQADGIWENARNCAFYSNLGAALQTFEPGNFFNVDAAYDYHLERRFRTENNVSIPPKIMADTRPVRDDIREAGNPRDFDTVVDTYWVFLLVGSQLLDIL